MAPWAKSGGTPSAAGEALQRLPPIVPAFWICSPPTSRAASWRPLNQGGRSARASVLQVVSAPIRQWSWHSAMPQSSPSRLMSRMSSSQGSPTLAG